MIKSLLRLWLAVALILAASAVLLLTDRQRHDGRRRIVRGGPGSPGKHRSIALFQHVSQATLEEGARGVFAGLEQSGYQEGRTLSGPPLLRRGRRRDVEHDRPRDHRR